ncbi:hypothetical protein [Nostoc sp. ChiQUE01b]|uniref:hypothetical protein n=1 Tax=Nostoc sp. ChiQUE01b TaxID=3075376 RepID=UPI002AD1ED79|nr:hypothetical protein [Nostoc sp. ChiQUE01b]MDZ8261997.1 hypothetical protein [Nostoc sp. ChiQUE01b]
MVPYERSILPPIENCDRGDWVINESAPAPHQLRILKYQEFPEDTVDNKCYCGLVENQEADSLYQY